jgi:ribonuclease BN (tRNA processing enzyme)
MRDQAPNRVIVLGTAGGPDTYRRAGTAIAVVVDDGVYLLDFGIGTSLRFRQAGLDPADLRAAFVTHLHSDHIAELYTFFTANWYYMQQRVPIYGPPSDTQFDLSDGLAVVAGDCPTPGLTETLTAFQRAYAYDNNVRIRDEAMPDLLGADSSVGIYPVELDAGLRPATKVYEDEHVAVSAAIVEHPPVRPAYAFRFDCESGSVVLSGDTRPCPGLAELARGADLLFHEVIDLEWLHEYATRGAASAQLIHHLLASHTADAGHTDAAGVAVPGVGAVASDAGVGRLILYHLTPAVDFLPDGRIVELPASRWAEDVANDFPGTLTTVANDLDVFPVVRLRH